MWLSHHHQPYLVLVLLHLVEFARSADIARTPGRSLSSPWHNTTTTRPSTTSSSTIKDAPSAAVINGDIVIGGLFPVHKKSNSALDSCGNIQADRGVQRLEAMLYTVDNINNNKHVLPHIKLGANILDTCSRATYALEQSLEYVRASLSSLDATDFVCDDKSVAKSLNAPVAVAAVVGGSYSTVSIQVANLLRLFKIPQVSYASTSAALSDKTRFDYFARTVPPDNLQAKAMADIVLHYNWTYVSTVASEGDYGEMGIYSFQYEARARNICIAITEKIPQSSNDATFDSVILNLKRKPTARAVVLFLRVEDARNLLKAAKRQNLTDDFVWVASDGWGKQDMPVLDNEDVAQGAITIELQSTVNEEFDAYFKSLNPFKNKRNPWFQEYWETVHSCTFGNANGQPGVPVCTGEELLTPVNYKQESKIQFVIDAVYAVAHALHAMLDDACGHFKGKRKRRTCMKEHHIDGASLYKDYILNVSFPDGHGSMVQFDKQGDGLGRYNVMNYRRSRANRKYEYVIVGQWNTNVLTMNVSAGSEPVMWPGTTYTVPLSQCSQPCRPDQIKHVQQGEICCWICTFCQPWEYVKDEFTCADCGEGWWPEQEKKAACYKLPVFYMQWDSLYAILPICLSIIGILLTSVVMITFVKHINTPVVKASGRELSFVLLSGFQLCYLMTFILLAKPSLLVCGLQRFGVGFGFSVTYASLLTKTNRISRIFDSASRSAKRPPFISPKSQLVITVLLIGVQVACTCIWFAFEPPGTRHWHPSGRRDEIVLKCAIRDESFLISLIYNMLLIMVCTVYAVKTRKIPENFNESKFIGFTMYTTCIIWLAFVPIYFGTLNSYQIQITTLCVSISLSASVALLCLFTPKMYIIVFQPSKNVRKLTMNSGQYKKAPTSMTAMNSNNGGSCSRFDGGETFRMGGPTTPLRAGGCTTETETDADKDSLASL